MDGVMVLPFCETLLPPCCVIGGHRFIDVLIYAREDVEDAEEK
jgi:hypothetical protein